jgi:hypothetical protein
MGLWHDVFTVFKFLFGLGALCALLGIGLGLCWFGLRFMVKCFLPEPSVERCPHLRKLFLEC